VVGYSSSISNGRSSMCAAVYFARPCVSPMAVVPSLCLMVSQV
jgi:hypothetical protein